MLKIRRSRESVLSLNWESLYWYYDIFILKGPPAYKFNQFFLEITSSIFLSSKIWWQKYIIPCYWSQHQGMLILCPLHPHPNDFPKQYMTMTLHICTQSSHWNDFPQQYVTRFIFITTQSSQLRLLRCPLWAISHQSHDLWTVSMEQAHHVTRNVQMTSITAV